MNIELIPKISSNCYQTLNGGTNPANILTAIAILADLPSLQFPDYNKAIAAWQSTHHRAALAIIREVSVTYSVSETLALEMARLAWIWRSTVGGNIATYTDEVYPFEMMLDTLTEEEQFDKDDMPYVESCSGKLKLAMTTISRAFEAEFSLGLNNERSKTKTIKTLMEEINSAIALESDMVSNQVYHKVLGLCERYVTSVYLIAMQVVSPDAYLLSSVDLRGMCRLVEAMGLPRETSRLLMSDLHEYISAKGK